MAEERTIVAHFPSSSKAEAVVDTLYSAGIKDVHVKRNRRFGVSMDAEYNDSLAIDYAETLIGMTLFSAYVPANVNNANRILMGSDPLVSGDSARGYGMAGGHAFTVIAFVPENRVDEIEKVIKEQGGEI